MEAEYCVFPEEEFFPEAELLAVEKVDEVRAFCLCSLPRSRARLKRMLRKRLAPTRIFRQRLVAAILIRLSRNGG